MQQEQQQTLAADQPQLQPRGHDHGQQWQSSLLDCSPCGTCLLSSCLPCILVGRTSSRMIDPTMQSHDELNSDCIIFAAIHYLTGCGWMYNILKRGEVRERYGIEGSGCGDCCTSYWCLCCAMIQQDKEVKLRTKNSGPIMQGYQSQKEGMHMPGPPYHQQQQVQQQPVQQRETQ